MVKNKAVIIRTFLRDYGSRMGYDARSFPNKVLSKVSQLKIQGIVIEETVGIRKFGGRWFSVNQDLFELWLDNNIKPGPKHGISTIIKSQAPMEFLKVATGVYNLRAVLDYFDPEIVDFYKVRNAAKKVEKLKCNPRTEIGAFLQNNLWVVEFPLFGVYLRENEPKIWIEY